MLRSLVAIAMLAVSMRAHAQVPVTRLAPADAKFATVFQGRSMNRLIEPLQSVHEMSDGRVLIRVDQRLILADPKTGTGEQGPPIPTRAVAVTDAEKRTYHAWEGRDRDRIFPDMELKDIEWPKTMCPWHAGYQPMEMPDGRVMIFRVPNTAMPATRYDVINRRGVVERQIAMAPNAAIIGFGKRSVYVRTIDGAIATVSRHPIDW